ncbi:UDP-2,4-diacetamido-2,4,6-trideoxy-beta-L-altropyranose hydrolase [Paucibacter oligotrophus]|uniref:UDP-2,4-diacetamido-2,4, 6-trideoxy-beta-L-altropyranose hydrolase n=1 Tax=Roseateles oligotrophus TaxID=1769250 RepID=A0A840L8D8_9BURK|nr:UDP-2,4-diacetamido-2,4,6-trideoxy-beta-L-altropyranose hydrolase [Roseateles oligotrophus]MBB4842409.1 UDP-2,4-diacetamido-2,4,6-trideoxy-beta-L-altropyranose hydrolase [Roseateles oligotrophus]
MSAMPPLIVIRADASSLIGSGHVRRCQSLAEALLDQGAAVLFVVRAGMSGEALFDGRALNTVFLPPRTASAAVRHDDPAHAHWLGASWQDDAADTLEILGERKVAAVVVDHYALDARWHAQVSERLDCKIVAIDDLADRPLAAALIVDHNHAESHARKYAVANQHASPILGGPHFALLGRRFRSASRNPAAADVRSIGIFMGGIDLENYSERVVRGLRDTADFNGDLEIVSTRSNPNLVDLLRLAELDGRCSVSLDLPDLADFFGRHELHIGAGGGATWERCCVGAPSLAVIVADNQRQVLDPLARLDVLAVTDMPAPDATAIGARARALIDSPALRLQLSHNAKELVDGQGCVRVAREIESLC